MFLRGADLPAWGPRGEWLAFNYGQIYKIKANGDSLTQLTYDGNNYLPAWSSDGKWIAYDNTNCGSMVEPAPPNSCGILIIGSGGSNKKLMVGGRYPDWSPDGGDLIFIGSGSEIFGVKLDGTLEVVQLTSFHQAYSYVDLRHPRYSPDQSKIIFFSAINESSGLWVMNSDGSDLKHLTKDGMDPSWPPDGKRIVYKGLEKTLWIMDADGKSKRQLTFRPKHN